jgi:hypothetical protein
VLAVQAEPPEIRPGETSTFEALVVGGEGTPSILWLACPPEDDGGIGFGCALDPDAFSEDATVDDLIAAGVLLFPEYTAEDDALAELTDDESLEGLYVTIQVTAFPGTTGEQTEDFDFNEVEAAYKRLVISEALTPNNNPRLTQFTVDGFDAPPQATVMVTPGQQYELAAYLPEEDVEEYEFVNRDNVLETRLEEPYVSWYTTGGTILEEVTLYPFLDSTWLAPPPCDLPLPPGGPLRPAPELPEDCVEAGAPLSGTWWAVVRDRRGGMSWIERQWEASVDGPA